MLSDEVQQAVQYGRYSHPLPAMLLLYAILAAGDMGANCMRVFVFTAIASSLLLMYRSLMRMHLHNDGMWHGAVAFVCVIMAAVYTVVLAACVLFWPVMMDSVSAAMVVLTCMLYYALLQLYSTVLCVRVYKSQQRGVLHTAACD